MNSHWQNGVCWRQEWAICAPLQAAQAKEQLVLHRVGVPDAPLALLLCRWLLAASQRRAAHWAGVVILQPPAP